ncbi:MAG: folylpolyglutamate synthase/dihydrofolate synthase family protein [Candidatus Neomarinimicrobiota bacterium]
MGLEHTFELLSVCHNPHKRLRVIHIAGTNGKGSTSSMVASILETAGYKVGLYTSPHLIKFNERISVNGVHIPDEFIAKFIEKNKKHIQRISSTFFETTTVMAFEYFVKQKVDIAIIEVGLGGRLDSTNVVDPLVTAITPISLDHQHILGSTLSEIAKEKAGIIKKGVPVVMAKQKIDAKKSIISAAKKMNAEIIETGKTKKLKYSQSGTEFSFMSEVFLTPLFGRHQSENAATAIQIVRQFDKKIENETIQKGLSQTVWLGRMQKLSNKLPIYYDVAHNIDGVKAAISAAITTQNQKPHILISFKGDKEIDLIANEISKNNSSLIISGSKNLELMSANELYSAFKKNVNRVEFNKIDTLDVALSELINRVKKTNKTGLIMGSHYMAKPIFDKFGILM